MRAGGAAGHADLPDDLPARHALVHLHHDLALVDVAGGHAMAVIEKRYATVEKEIRRRKRDDAVRRRVDGRALCRRDVDAEMRILGLTVEYALIAPGPAHDTRTRPIEAVGEPGLARVARARLGDLGPLALDPRDDVRRR